MEDARALLAHAERAIERARRAAAGEIGTPLIGYTRTAAFESLPTIVDAFKTRVPESTVLLHEVYAAELIPAVAAGAFDLGIVPEPEPSRRLETREIRREPWVVALARTHPLAGEPVIPLSALATETFAVWPRALAPGNYDAMLAAFAAAGCTPKLDTTPGGSAIWNDVVQGRRTHLTVASNARQLPDGVVLVPLAPPIPSLGLSVVWRSVDASPLGRRFLDVAADVATAEGWLG